MSTVWKYTTGVPYTQVTSESKELPVEPERSYTVAGMTCEHCVRSVSEEVCELPGVEHVEVDLASGRLVVRGERLDDTAIARAVREAGYEVVS